MSETTSKTCPGFSVTEKRYWKTAADCFSNTRLVVFASLIAALRVALKFARIPLAAGLYITFDCYVNALGSIVYGPLVALAVGAVSDTIGAVIAPSGPYFLPFILVEMLSGFIFALYFWKRSLSVPRTLLARFTVNLICNIVLNSLFMKWYYYVFYSLEDATAYSVINLVRIVKNLVMFPMESLLIVVTLRAVLPFLRQTGIVGQDVKLKPLKPGHIVLTGVLLLFSVGLVLFYIFYLKDFISLHNFKWL